LNFHVKNAGYYAFLFQKITCGKTGTVGVPWGLNQPAWGSEDVKFKHMGG